MFIIEVSLEESFIASKVESLLLVYYMYHIWSLQLISVANGFTMLLSSS
jgi:hypothetical protein